MPVHRDWISEVPSMHTCRRLVTDAPGNLQVDSEGQPEFFFFTKELRLNIFMAYPTANLGFTVARGAYIYKSIDTQTTLMK